MPVDKVIVTNLTALRQKYEAAGVKTIQAAVQALIAADKARGLTTKLIALDDEAGMKKLKAPPVKDATDPKQNKRAIDGVYKALVPDYLMILGAIDVVPHQDVKNPLYTPNPDGDTDEFAYSDLPYACDAPYSQDVNDFTGPTRVVGRLPDLTGANNPKYLLGLLQTATKWKSRPRTDYQNYLGISAEKWRDSTSESLQKVFNTDADLQTSPSRGYKWTSKLINRRLHFINCHGGDMIPDFYGQSSTDDEEMPVSHQAAFVALPKNIIEGTVAAVECCFGGQLYDPSGAENNQMGMCNTYLDRKAYGFFGSTTTAYGPFSGNDQADLICQYFLQRVLGGASLGRAALEARHKFVEKTTPLNLKNQKTLAQFNLFGDPSITPVAAPTSKLAVGAKIVHLTTGVAAAGAKSAANSKAVHQAAASERAERRQTLRAKGTMLAGMQPAMTKTKTAPPKNVAASLQKLARQLNLQHVDTISYRVEAPAQAHIAPQNAMAKGIMKVAAAKRPETTAFHVFIGTPQSTSANMKGIKKGAAKQGATKAGADGGTSAKKHPIRKIVVLEAKEVGGNIVISEGHSK